MGGYLPGGSPSDRGVVRLTYAFALGRAAARIPWAIPASSSLGRQTSTVAIHWHRLLESLDSWADVRVVSSGIEVTFARPSGGHGTVELVLTTDEWDSLVSLVGRDTPHSERERILALREDQPFLVCDRGADLIPTATRELPPLVEP